ADVDLETLRAICQSVNIPVVAIGGITEGRISELRNTGVAGVAVVSAIFGQKNITTGTRALKKACKEVFTP
ncbi:MAG: thiamine-phosphate diphosphorylase, partial [Evtepia sp.]|nr:thiamine-phosphate diphosphorylase [Evtepia sp.]